MKSINVLILAALVLCSFASDTSASTSDDADDKCRELHQKYAAQIRELSKLASDASQNYYDVFEVSLAHLSGQALVRMDPSDFDLISTLVGNIYAAIRTNLELLVEVNRTVEQQPGPGNKCRKIAESAETHLGELDYAQKRLEDFDHHTIVRRGKREFPAQRGRTAATVATRFLNLTSHFLGQATDFLSSDADHWPYLSQVLPDLTHETRNKLNRLLESDSGKLVLIGLNQSENAEIAREMIEAGSRVGGIFGKGKTLVEVFPSDSGIVRLIKCPSGETPISVTLDRNNSPVGLICLERNTDRVGLILQIHRAERGLE